ncbi:LysR family transcriptional regulator [Streptomyces shenzhenensis]|uniref:LysR family transcriptional regulator n=1 Tax=Streptomyces shenzhenensis TaxID=943815 RepID=UPI0036841E5A
MELRQLEYFIAVAEEGSFTRAAARLQVAQPGVSAQIRHLEKELGEQLLDRSGRTVRLTKVGAAVIPYARAALAAVVDTRLVVDEFTGLIRGHVALGVVPSCGGIDLPALLAGFHKDHPAVEITLSEANSGQLIDALRTGLLDAAFIGLSANWSPDIETHVIVDEALVGAVSHDDPLAGREKISMADIRERTLISLPQGTGMRASLDEACSAAGFTPRVGFEAGNPKTLAELASWGLGLAILPKPLVRARSAQLSMLRFSPEPRARIALGWRDGGPSSPAARAFITRALKDIP